MCGHRDSNPERPFGSLSIKSALRYQLRHTRSLKLGNNKDLNLFAKLKEKFCLNHLLCCMLPIHCKTVKNLWPWKDSNLHTLMNLEHISSFTNLLTGP